MLGPPGTKPANLIDYFLSGQGTVLITTFFTAPAVSTFVFFARQRNQNDDSTPKKLKKPMASGACDMYDRTVFVFFNSLSPSSENPNRSYGQQGC